MSGAEIGEDTRQEIEQAAQALRDALKNVPPREAALFTLQLAREILTAHGADVIDLQTDGSD